MKHSGRSTFVELSEAGAAMVDASPAPETEPMAAVEATPRVSVPCAPREIDPATASAIAEGVDLVRHLLANAPQPPRWPIYLRQFKQFIRASYPEFDDRKYGSIVDLMRACQKEGLVKIDRDRWGGLRVVGVGGFGASPSGTSAVSGAPAVVSSPVNVNRPESEPKSEPPVCVTGDNGKETGKNAEAGKVDDAGSDVPVQIAPIAPDNVDSENDLSKSIAPDSAKDLISAAPVARVVKRRPRRTTSSEDVANRPKRARKAPAGGGGGKESHRKK